MKFTVPTALFVILLVIKLLVPSAGVTWFWVFAPLWMGFLALFLIFMIAALIVGFAKR